MIEIGIEIGQKIEQGIYKAELSALEIGQKFFKNASFGLWKGTVGLKAY